MNGLAEQLITHAFSQEPEDTGSAEMETVGKLSQSVLVEPRIVVTCRGVCVRNPGAEATHPDPCRQVFEVRTQESAFF